MRHHVLESGLQKAVKRAAKQAGITKKIGCHTLRHSFATHMLENGVNIRVLQEILGHADVKTTNIYAEVDLEMKAKALAHCEISGSEQIGKLWHKNRGVMNFLRNL